MTKTLKTKALKRLNKILSNRFNLFNSYNFSDKATKIQFALNIISKDLYLSEKSIVSNFR